MKKTLLTIAFVIVMTISAYAQFKPFQFGLKVEPGVNWSKLNSEHLYDSKTSLNFNWGFVGNYYFVENYGFSTGFNVRFMNAKYSFDYTTTDNSVTAPNKITRTIKNQYLEIPIGLIMRTEKMGDIRIIGNIGYGLGFLLNSKERNYDENDNEKSLDKSSSYSSVRHALIVKLGIEYYVSRSSCITAALVFNNNIANIYSSKDDYKHDVLLNNLGLEIGFMF